MSKFNFGTPGATNASTPGFGFGTQPAAQPATGFGSTSFGATPAQPVGATTFGGTPTQAPPSFGAATAQSTGSTLFGSTPAQPAAATPAPSLNFSFGNNAAAPSTQAGTLTLGAAAASSGGLFGNTSLLGQPQQQQQQQQQQPQQQQQQQQQNTSISFGTPAAAKPAGLSFGLGSNTPNTGLGGTGTGLSFGTAATTTTGLSFGTSTATSTSGGLSFGAAPASGGLTFGTTSTAAPASTSTNFSFTAATPATTSTSLFGSNTGGLFGAKSTATASLTTSTTTTSTNRGLGGLDVSVTNKGLTQGSTTPTVAKENPLPNELMQTIDGFKEFVKTQKGLSSDVARGSSRPLNRCAEDTASLMELLTTLAGSVQRDRSLADKLKQDTARALQNAEIAQRTHDTPAGLQYENNAPLVFFLELAENFENDLMLFKSQIESTEKHIQTMMSPKTLTPQELTTAMSKLHDSLVAVAGKLQGVHSKVQQQKEQYLNIRKYVLKDCTNVFDDINSSNGKVNRTSFGKVTSGPTPFGPGTNRSFLSSTTMNTTQPPAYGTQNTLGWGSGNATTGGLSQPPTQGLTFNSPVNLTAPLSTGGDMNSSFQLQKPPTGNKRGKH